MYTESASHLDEVSRQMAASIEKQAQSQWNMVEMFYHYFENLADGNWETFEQYAIEKKDELGFETLCLMDENATYYDKHRRFSLLSQESVYKQLLAEHKPLILDNVIFGDKNKLLFLAPVNELTLNGITFRAMGAVYDTYNLFDILDIEAFNGKATLYITHENGVVLFRTEQDDSITGYNLFNSLSTMEFHRGSLEQLRQDISTGGQDVMTVLLNGQEYYLNHTPVGVDDWQLVMLVPSSVISGRIQQTSLLAFICFFIISGLTVTAFILFYSSAAKKVLYAEETARKAAESANHSKSQFLSNMSHDIRTPMNAVIGMTKIASDHLEEPEKVRDCLQKIDLSGRLLVGLINDILDMSKIESGKMVLNEDTASLVDTMNNLVGIIQPSIDKKRQNFNIRLCGVQHEMLIFDSLRLNQVLINLLGNATKFTPEGGSISVDVIERSSDREGFVHFIIRVADTGIGMSPEFQEHLFDSFSRERDRRVAKTEGSGLGMAITKMIITMMEGSISVESQLDKGSIFSVELDLRIAGEPEAFQLPSGWVLVVDDDPDTCCSAQNFLQEMGLEADIAFSGSEAVQKVLKAHAQGKEYNMILLDWRMPGVGGVEAAKAIREQIDSKIPILIISAYDWFAIAAEARQAGVDGFIQKPFFKSTLYHSFQQYVLHNNTTSGVQIEESFNLNGKHILLAEDNELNREIAVELLKSLGAFIDTAENGLEVVEHFSHAPAGFYDLILMDIQMPLMNGYEAARSIRKMDRSDAGRIPIFAMTADAFAEDIEVAKNAGMNCHLAKPLDIPVMLREIKKHLQV